MTLHYKIDGEWTLVQRPYVKVAGVWVPVQTAHVKRSGVWTQAYEWDIEPSNPPEISLEVIEKTSTTNNGGGQGTEKVSGRWIKVGVRLPGVSNDADLKRVRILTTYNDAMPTTQYGGTYTSRSDSNWAAEPWSEWRFNSFGDHTDSSVYSYKEWPVNAADGTILAGGKTYHFAGWSEDENGNWSAGTFTSIHIPKDGVSGPNVLIKEAGFQPNSSGSLTTSGFVSGDLVQQSNPASRGLWFHGGQFRDSIGAKGTPKITSAKIRIERKDDGGQPAANVYLFHHDYATSGDLPGSPTFSHTTLLGTINKGEVKWFDLPDSHVTALEADGVRGFGLHYKDPAKASAFADDYSTMKSISDSLRCGEVNIVWQEKL